MILSRSIFKKAIAQSHSWYTEVVCRFRASQESLLIRSTEFACYYSPVLRAAFESNLLEGQTQKYRLEDVSIDAFRLLVMWLYSQDIEAPPISPQTETEFTDEEDAIRHSNAINSVSSSQKSTAQNEFLPRPKVSGERLTHERNMIHLWIVADRLLIPSLQNLCIRKLEELWTPDGPPLDYDSWITYLFENTSCDSRLRLLVIDKCAYCMASEQLLEDSEILPKDFLLGIAVVLSAAVSRVEEEHHFYEEPREKSRPVYQCKRKWRSYLVPEDVE